MTPCLSAFSQGHVCLYTAVAGAGSCLVLPECLVALIQLLWQRAEENVAASCSFRRGHPPSDCSLTLKNSLLPYPKRGLLYSLSPVGKGGRDLVQGAQPGRLYIEWSWL